MADWRRLTAEDWLALRDLGEARESRRETCHLEAMGLACREPGDGIRITDQGLEVLGKKRGPDKTSG